MGSKGKNRSKGKKIVKHKKMPMKAEKGTIIELETKKGKRYFKGSGRELMIPVKNPRKK